MKEVFEAEQAAKLKKEGFKGDFVLTRYDRVSL